jgi:hypothetical protein
MRIPEASRQVGRCGRDTLGRDYCDAVFDVRQLIDGRSAIDDILWAKDRNVSLGARRRGRTRALPDHVEAYPELTR